MPYTGWAGFAYDAALPREGLKTVLVEAARRDIRVLSMGKDLLDLYEEVNHVVPIHDRRWVIEHISTLTRDEIHRMRDLGVVVTTHTHRYISKEGEILRPRVAPRRRRGRRAHTPHEPLYYQRGRGPPRAGGGGARGRDRAAARAPRRRRPRGPRGRQRAAGALWPDL